MSGAGVPTDYGAIGSDVVGAFSDVMTGMLTAGGDAAAAKAYNQAAAYAGSNAKVAQRSGTIQEAQANRIIFQTASSAQATEGAGGIGSGGSAQYISRSTEQQGGLEKAIIANNTQLQVQGFEAEQAADLGQAAQATAQGNAAKVGGFLGAVGKILSIF